MVVAVQAVSGAGFVSRQPPPYSGYFTRDISSPDPYLTQVGRGSTMGEFMRRFWQPVGLSEELTDLPKAIEAEFLARYSPNGNVARTDTFIGSIWAA